MITNFKKYETAHNPDLRQISNYVKCFKNIYTFKKGEIYKVANMMGDPQGAIEKYQINDYLPAQCISTINIEITDNGTKEQIKFKVSNDYNVYAGYLNFFDYFDIMEDVIAAEPYNL